jgi:hypothetical protein
MSIASSGAVARTGSAAERRRTCNAALVAHHPGWTGIRHPELIPFPPRRFSQLDVLPAVERARAWPEQRAERNRTIVASHPRWRHIRHPERIGFLDAADEGTALLAYRAIRVAREHARESQRLYDQIAAVAGAIGRRTWPWSAAPTLAPAPPPVPTGRRWLPKLPERPRISLRSRPAGRLLTH